jgi:prolyl-tRNA synthetase
MRMTRLFGRTLRDAPSEAESESYRLILRAGLVRQTAAGIYSYLPLGWRVVEKIATILRDEMNRVDGQEVHLPVVVPAELWKESGRWQQIDETLWRTQDRNGRDFVLAMTHEEIVTDLSRRDVRSYRQLPYVLYQIQTKVRDEPRPRGGLVRMREFLMKDAYSFHCDAADLDAYYPRIYQAYVNIYRRVEVPVVPVEADPGMIGGSGSHEFVYPSDLGEAVILRCPSCGYAANQEIARARTADQLEPFPGAVPPPEPVHTPNVATIAELQAFLGLPADALLKTLIYHTGRELAAAVIHGNRDVNEVKLANALGVPAVRLASDEELRLAGINRGFISPIGLSVGQLVVDAGVSERPYVAGANRPDYHLRNVVPGRDFALDRVADLTLVAAGASCPHCGKPLVEEQALEVGHTFKLGTKYSAAMGATFHGPDGHDAPIVMGCYGIGLDRLLAAIVQANHDERGIIWPAAVAPYPVHLVGLNLDFPEVAEAAESVYATLGAAGVEPLFDDRPDSPGVKFADADLIGVPLRLTVSRRSLRQSSVELTVRATNQSSLVPLAEVAAAVRGYVV